MDSQTRKSYENSGRRYLKNVSERFLFNPVRGIYQGKPDERESKGSNHATGSQRETPFHVNVRRDRMAVAVSALTLIFLVGTLYFTRQQWLTMNDTLCEIRKQTGFAQTTAADATQNMRNAEEFFRLDERAWVEIESIKPEIAVPNSQLGTIYKYDFFIRNTGKTLARNIVVKTNNMWGPYLTKENEKKIIEQVQGRSWLWIARYFVPVRS